MLKKCLILAVTLFAHTNMFANETRREGKVSNFVKKGSLLSFECHLQNGDRDVIHRVEVDTNNQRLKFLLDDGTEVQGYAAVTKIAESTDTFFYLTNGFVPYHYRFTVTVAENGSSAKLELTEGAVTLNCAP